VRVGILALQGGVYEHAYMLKQVVDKRETSIDVVFVKRPSQLRGLDAIIIPGGESTTIGVVAEHTGLLGELREAIEDGLPVMGVCAGAILLAKSVRDRRVGETKQPLLGLMNIEVVRNYYGRQRESFEIDVEIPAVGKGPFRAVFIRAPAITKTWGEAEPLARLDEAIIMARQGNMLATTFHPELTSDTRIHEYFLYEVARK